MQKLNELIEAAKCRKGKARGTSRRGAYWLACDPIIIRSAGGDGIGQNAPDLTYHLELRHFRSGEIRAVIHRNAWHQNGSYSGAGNNYYGVDLGDCESIEDVIVALKARSVDEEISYSDYQRKSLAGALAALGLPDAGPSPDEVP